MKRTRAISIFLCIVLVFLCISCKGNISSDETYRNQYVTAYKGTSDALGRTGNSVYSVNATVREDFRDCYKLSTDSDMVKSMGAFVYFLYLLYKNGVPITQLPIGIDCDYVVDGKVVQDNYVTLLSEVDIGNGKIIGNIIGEEKSESFKDTGESVFYIEKFYIYVEIDFDFTTLSVSSFIIDMMRIVDGKLSFDFGGLSCIYENGRIYTAMQENFADKLNGYVDFISDNYYYRFSVLAKNSVKADRDYSPEYTESMNVKGGF